MEQDTAELHNLARGSSGFEGVDDIAVMEPFLGEYVSASSADQGASDEVLQLQAEQTLEAQGGAIASAAAGSPRATGIGVPAEASTPAAASQAGMVLQAEQLLQLPPALVARLLGGTQSFGGVQGLQGLQLQGLQLQGLQGLGGTALVPNQVQQRHGTNAAPVTASAGTTAAAPVGAVGAGSDASPMQSATVSGGASAAQFQSATSGVTLPSCMTAAVGAVGRSSDSLSGFGLGSMLLSVNQSVATPPMPPLAGTALPAVAVPWDASNGTFAQGQAHAAAAQGHGSLLLQGQASLTSQGQALPNLRGPSMPLSLPLSSAISLPDDGQGLRKEAVLVQQGNSLVLATESDWVGYDPSSLGDLGALDPRRSRSSKQQMQNKQAQARYRERQKSKLVDMERTIQELQARLAGMQTLEASYRSLEGKATAMQSELQVRDKEIARLKLSGQDCPAGSYDGAAAAAGNSNGLLSDAANGQSSHHALAAPAGTGASALASDGGAPASAWAEDGTAAGAGPSFAQMSKSHQELAASVDTLRQFLDSHNLKAGPAGAGESQLSPAAAKQLAKLVDDAVTRRINVKKQEDANMTDLMAFDLRQLSTLECCRQRRRWQAITQHLGISSRQKNNIKALRDAYLQRLQQIYTERQMLNMQALSLLMPRNPEDSMASPAKGGTAAAATPTRRKQGADGMDESGWSGRMPASMGRPDEQAGADAGALGGSKEGSAMEQLEGQLQCLAINGYLYASSNYVTELSQALAEIKENLESEQKLIAEANYVMLNRVLNGPQAGRFIVEAYPDHLDCLALANALAITESEGEVDDGPEDEMQLTGACAGTAERPAQAVPGQKQGAVPGAGALPAQQQGLPPWAGRVPGVGVLPLHPGSLSNPAAGSADGRPKRRREEEAGAGSGDGQAGPMSMEGVEGTEMQLLQQQARGGLSPQQQQQMVQMAQQQHQLAQQLQEQEQQQQQQRQAQTQAQQQGLSDWSPCANSLQSAS